MKRYFLTPTIKNRQSLVSLITAICLIFISVATSGLYVVAQARLAGLSDDVPLEAASEAWVIGEDVSKRDATTKHFVMSDGSITAVEYGAPVHFLEQEEWVEYDNTLELTTELLPGGTARGGAEYTTAQSDFAVRLAADTGAERVATIQRDHHTISWKYIGMAQKTMAPAENIRSFDRERSGLTDAADAAVRSAGDTASALSEEGAFATEEQPYVDEDRRVSLDELDDIVAQRATGAGTYGAIYPGVDLEVIVTSLGVKENLILANARATSEFVIEYQIGELVARAIDGQTVGLYAGEDCIFMLSAPAMIDAAGENSVDLTYEIVSCQEGTLTLRLTADREWLDADERVYPVTVDPVTYSRGVLSEFWAASLQEGKGASPGTFTVGEHTSGPYNALLGFNQGMCWEGTLLSAQLILEATSVTKIFSDSPMWEYVTVYPYLYAWNPSTATYSNAINNRNPVCHPQMLDRVKITEAGVNYAFDITPYILGEVPNQYGLFFGTSGNNLRITFPSSYYAQSSTGRCVRYNYRVKTGYDGESPMVGVPAGRGGSALVNTYTKQPYVYLPLFAGDGGTKASVDMHLFYDPTSNKAAYGSASLDGAWSLNYQQSYQLVDYMEVPGHYKYTDEYGTVYTFGASGGAMDPLTTQSGITMAANPPQSGWIGFTRGELTNWFDSSWRLARISHSNGTFITVGYRQGFSASNPQYYQIAQVTDGAGRVYRFVYDGSDKLTSITDPASRAYTFTYTGGKLASVEYPDGESVDMTYANNKLTEVASPDGTFAAYDYTGTDITVRQHDGTNTATSFAVSGPAGHTLVTDVTGRKFSYNFTVDNEGAQAAVITDWDTGYTMQYGWNGTAASEGMSSLGGSVLPKKNYIRNPLLTEAATDYSGIVSRTGNGTGAFDTYSSLRLLETIGGGTREVYQTVTDLTEGWYTFSAYASGDMLQGDGISVFARVSGSSSLLAQSDNRTGQQTNYERQQVSFWVSNGQSIDVGVRLVCPATGEGSTQAVYVDAFQLVEGMSATPMNLVENGEFTRGTASDATRFTRVGSTGGFTTTFTDAPLPIERIYSVASSYQRTGIEQSYRAAETYGDTKIPIYIGGWGKAVAVPSSGEFGLVVETATSLSGARTRVGFVPFNTNTAEWQYAMGQVEVPGNAPYIFIGITCDFGSWQAGSLEAYALGDANLTYTAPPSSATPAPEPSPTAWPLDHNYSFDHDLKQNNQKVGSISGSASGGVRYNSVYDLLGNLLQSTTQLETTTTTPIDGHLYVIRSGVSTNVMTKQSNGAVRCDPTRADNENQLWQAELVNAATKTWRFKLAGSSPAQYLWEQTTNKDELTAHAGNPTTATNFALSTNSDGTISLQGSTSRRLTRMEQGMSSAAHDDHIFSYAANATIDVTQGQKWYLVDATAAQTAAFIQTSSEYANGGNYLTKTVDENGGETVYGYNSLTGNLQTATDPEGVTTTYTYNAMNQLTAVTRDALTVTYGYDVERLMSISVASGNTIGTRYALTYDAFGQLTAIKVGDGTTWTSLASYAYDLQGKPIRLQYANGNIVAYEYDTIDRLAREIHYDNATAETQGNGAVVEYHYDAVHQLALTIDGVSGTSTRWEYGADGSYMGEVRYNTTNPTQFKAANETFRYKPLDDRTVGSLSYTDRYSLNYGGMSSMYETLTHTDKTYSQVTTLWASGNGAPTSLARSQYDNFGRITNHRSYMPASLYLPTYYTYASGGETGSTSNRVAQVQTDWGTFKFDYDANGNITHIKDYSNAVQNRYEYDAKGQLVREDNRALDWSKEYVYDAFGNFLAQRTYAFTLSTLGSQTSANTYAYGNAQWPDQLTAYNGQTLTYDAMGNPLTYRDGMTMTWDNGRHLKTLTKGGTTTSYTYDSTGIRQSKTVGGTKTQYYYHNDQLHGWKDSNGNWMQFQIDGEGNYISLTYNGTRYWFARNLQGDITRIIDSDYNTIATYTYDAWGNHIVRDGTGTAISDAYGTPLSGQANHIGNLNPVRYRSYCFDGVEGLYYLMSRYYDAKVGRFINVDEPNMVMTERTYAYCNNAPVMHVDPVGLAAYKIGPPAEPKTGFNPSADPYKRIKNRTPTWAERISFTAVKSATLRFFDKYNMYDARAAYSHYIGATGRDYRINMEKAVREITALRNRINSEIKEAVKFAEAHTGPKRNGPVAYDSTNFRFTGQAESVSSVGMNTNWYATIGGCRVWSSASVKYNPSTKSTTMSMLIHLVDWYNFDDVGGIRGTATRHTFGLHQQLGLSNSFYTRASVGRTVIWKKGNSNSYFVAPS